MNSLKGKTQRIFPVGHATARRPLGRVDSVLQGKSTDLGQNAEEANFSAATIPLLLSVVLPNCVYQYLSTKLSKLHVTQVDSSLIFAYSKVSSVCSYRRQHSYDIA